MKLENLGEVFLSSAAFAALGLAVFGLAIWLFVKLAPFSMRKEIETDQNTALAIIVAGVIIGLAIIIGAAVHG